jgi:lipopolysaccharide transport system ATP-binding protein
MSSESPPPVIPDDLAIVAESVGKVYQIYERPGDRLREFLAAGIRTYHRKFWALRDVSFDVRRGETVGFLGRNGAGKSTLLQIVAGTLPPSEGQVIVRGRLSALLELGTGFNPEFTGQENVLLYCRILGLSDAEIGERYDRILTFADIGDFLDVPVKAYSSGMLVRLAFATAINIDPEVLIVDEALAVGDARFVARCMTQLRRMQNDGVSMLFVGHDTDAVMRLCSKAYVLHDGYVVQHGQPAHTVSWYLAFASTGYDVARMHAFDEPTSPSPVAADQQPPASIPTSQSEADAAIAARSDELPEFQLFRFGDGAARIIGCEMRNERGEPSSQVPMHGLARLHLTCEFLEDQPQHLVGFYMKDRLNLHVIGINSYQEHVPERPVRKGEVVTYVFEFNVELKPGYYSVSVSIAYNQLEHRWMDYVENMLIVHVNDPVPGRMVFGVCLPSTRRVTVHTSEAARTTNLATAAET